MFSNRTRHWSFDFL